MPILDLTPPNKKKVWLFLAGRGGRLPPSENEKAQFVLFSEKKKCGPRVWASGQGLQPGPPASPRPGPKASRPVPGLVQVQVLPTHGGRDSGRLGLSVRTWLAEAATAADLKGGSGGAGAPPAEAGRYTTLSSRVLIPEGSVSNLTVGQWL